MQFTRPLGRYRSGKDGIVEQKKYGERLPAAGLFREDSRIGVLSKEGLVNDGIVETISFYEVDFNEY